MSVEQDQCGDLAENNKGMFYQVLNGGGGGGVRYILLLLALLTKLLRGVSEVLTLKVQKIKINK